jgi:YbbR domain-containing protein
VAFVSLLLGLGVWLYASGAQSRKITREVKVPLEITRTSPEVIPIDIPKSITAQVIGTPDELEQIRWDDVGARAFVDLSSATPGIDEYRVAFERPPGYAHLEWRYPDTVMIASEEVVTIRREVVVEPTGDTPTGLKLASATVDPQRIDIKGARSAIESVETVKVQLNMANAQSGRSYMLRVLVLNAEGRAVAGLEKSNELVSVIPVLATSQPRRTVLVSPQWKGQPEPGHRVESVQVSPNQVTVEGDRTRLGDLLVVETEPIDLGGLKEGLTRSVSLVFPPGIRPTGVRRVTVRIRIVPASSEPVDRPIGP